MIRHFTVFDVTFLVLVGSEGGMVAAFLIGAMEKQSDNKNTGWVVYAITATSDESKARWQKVGRAFVNRDGSFNLLVDSVPLSGKLQMRRHEFDSGIGRSGRVRKEAA